MALYDDASFIFLASAAAGVENKDFSKAPCVKPVEVTGSELLSSTDGDWTLGTGVSISNGVITVTSHTGSRIAYQAITELDNKSAKISFTVSNYSAGTIRGQFFGSNEQTSNVGQNGRFAFTVDNIGVDHNGNSGFAISLDFVGTISDISIKEVTTKAADFDISRDANLDATRVGPTGLIEKGRENLAHYSNNFATVSGGGGWGHTNINNISTGQDGYDGTTNATAVFASTGSSKHQVTLGVAQSLPGTDFSITGVFTLSVHAKPNGYDHLVLRSDVTNIDASFNIATGVVGTKGSKCIASSMTDVGNGFYRCQATFQHSGSVEFLAIGMMEQDDTTDFTGSTSKGYILQDAQLEVGLTATELIPTSGAAGTAGIKEDEPRFDYPLAGGPPSLLLEPQRQNLILNSEYIGGSTWTDQSSGVTAVNNDAVSPEGVKNATKLVIADGDSEGAEWRLASALSVTDEKLYTFSVFAKAAEFDGIQLDVSDDRFGNANVTATLTGDGSITAGDGTTASSIEDYGNGWYRIIMVATCSSTGNSAVIFRLHAGGINGTGDGSKGIHVYGAQFEEGPYATSYIPTHGASATRSGEGEAVDTFKAQLPTALNGASAYTLFIDLTVTDLEEETNYIDVLVFKDSSAASDKYAFKLETYTSGGTSSLRGFAYKTSDPNAVASNAHDTIPIGSRCKLAVVFNSASGVKYFYNGSGTPIMNYSEATTYESVDVIAGAEGTITGQRSRTRIQAIHGYPSALSDAQCISLTTL